HSKMTIEFMGSNLAQIMELWMISKFLGICIEARSLLPFAPKTSGVELVAPFLETIPPTRQ
ncbi:MAG: hypothetical protein ABJQ14_08345, partial [Hyphomicrobiales bacterium]